VQHIGKTGSGSNDEALDALMALGYSLSDGISALDNVDNNLPTSDRVTQALKNAARQ
jgi:Holliday junction resolvasome RuvABC DNA-binding subunit